MTSETQLIANWLQEAGRNEPILSLTDAQLGGANENKPRNPEAIVRIDTMCRLVAVHGDNEYVIGSFAGNRRGMVSQDGSCFLVNNNETGLRWCDNLVERVWRAASANNPCIHIPFAALEGAQIFPDSIRIVHGDRNFRVQDRVAIIRPPMDIVHMPQGLAIPGRVHRFGDAPGSLAVERDRWRAVYIWQVRLPNGTWERLSERAAWEAPAGLFANYGVTLPPCFVFTALSAVDDQRRTYLSGWDHLENPTTYFLAQLPHRDPDTEAPIATVAEAFEALKPEIVRKAEADQRDVRRHGDIFFIATNTVPPDYRVRNRNGKTGRFSRVNPRDFVIYNTGHTAEFIHIQENGAALCTGRILHEPWLIDPARRENDHDPLILPRNTWFLAVRNTVPTV